MFFHCDLYIGTNFGLLQKGVQLTSLELLVNGGRDIEPQTLVYIICNTLQFVTKSQSLYSLGYSGKNK